MLCHRAMAEDHGHGVSDHGEARGAEEEEPQQPDDPDRSAVGQEAFDLLGDHCSLARDDQLEIRGDGVK